MPGPFGGNQYGTCRLAYNSSSSLPDPGGGTSVLGKGGYSSDTLVQSHIISSSQLLVHGHERGHTLYYRSFVTSSGANFFSTRNLSSPGNVPKNALHLRTAYKMHSVVVPRPHGTSMAYVLMYMHETFFPESFLSGQSHRGEVGNDMTQVVRPFTTCSCLQLLFGLYGCHI